MPSWKDLRTEDLQVMPVRGMNAFRSWGQDAAQAGYDAFRSPDVIGAYARGGIPAVVDEYGNRISNTMQNLVAADGLKYDAARAISGPFAAGASMVYRGPSGIPGRTQYGIPAHTPNPDYNSFGIPKHRVDSGNRTPVGGVPNDVMVPPSMNTGPHLASNVASSPRPSSEVSTPGDMYEVPGRQGEYFGGRSNTSDLAFNPHVQIHGYGVSDPGDWGDLGLSEMIEPEYLEQLRRDRSDYEGQRRIELDRNQQALNKAESRFKWSNDPKDAMMIQRLDAQRAQLIDTFDEQNKTLAGREGYGLQADTARYGADAELEVAMAEAQGKMGPAVDPQVQMDALTAIGVVPEKAAPIAKWMATQLKSESQVSVFADMLERFGGLSRKDAYSAASSLWNSQSAANAYTTARPNTEEGMDAFNVLNKGVTGEVMQLMTDPDAEARIGHTMDNREVNARQAAQVRFR